MDNRWSWSALKPHFFTFTVLILTAGLYRFGYVPLAEAMDAVPAEFLTTNYVIAKYLIVAIIVGGVAFAIGVNVYFSKNKRSD